MKNKIITAGLMVVGAAGLQTALAAGSDDAAVPKMWNVSGTLRGFYDDNYNTTSTKQGSLGFEVSPTVSLNVPLQQTDFGIRYTYGMFYYDKREQDGMNPVDQTHQVDVWVDHAFNERWKGTAKDTFAVGQEPELLGSSASAPFRVNGNNIANHGTLMVDTEWTRLFSTSVSYGNNFYDYSDKGAGVQTNASAAFQAYYPSNVGSPGYQQLTGNGASRAGTLNRVEQSASLDLQWTIQPETMGFVGYQFNIANYTGNEPIGVFNYQTGPLVTDRRNLVYMSDSRDSITHYGYVGVKHQINANLEGRLQGGVSYTDSYNDPLQTTTQLNPYADLSLTYTYAQGSYVQFGAKQDVGATDVASVNTQNGSLTQNTENSILHLSINHQITSSLIGSLIGRYQYSKFNGGQSNDGSESTYSFGANLHYQINRHLGVDTGYNYDTLVSQSVGRNYNRNRVYIGVGANY
jgi:hypothetical protein